MAFSAAASLLNTLVLLSQIVSQVQGYAIDPSCVPYDTDGKDKTAMVKAAMAEAQSMATLARDHITQPFDLFDDSKLLLFPGAMDADFVDVQGYYQTLLDTIPWTVTSSQSLVTDKVTIYCGDANFAAWTDDPSGNAWMDMTSFNIFVGPTHAGDATIGLCGSGAIAQTLNAGHITNPSNNAAQDEIQVLILCDAALVKGSSQDTSESRGTLQEIYDAGELFHGRAITNIGYQHALSWTVLHELFHAALTNTMLKGAAEIYGWDDCTWSSGFGAVTIFIAQAKVNCDTLAYYGMTLKVADIDNDLFFSRGFLGSRAAALLALNNNWIQQQQAPIWGNP